MPPLTETPPPKNNPSVSKTMVVLDDLHKEEKQRVKRSKWILVMIAFALAGSSVVRIRPYLMSRLLPKDAPFFLKVTVYLLLVFPLYQVFLLLYGTLLGQFSFFWEKEKKIFGKIYRLIVKKKG